MLKSYWMMPLSLFWLLGFQQAALAFDPFTAVAGSQAVGGLFGGGGGVDQALDLGDALADLMSEAEVDENLVKEIDSNVKRLEEVNRQVREAKYVSNEIKDLLEFDLSRSKSLSSKLRKISGKIRQGKKVYNFLRGASGRQSTAAIQIEQVKLNYRILDELRNLRLTQFNRYLLEKERETKLHVGLERTLKEEEAYRKGRLAQFQSKRSSL